MVSAYVVIGAIAGALIAAVGSAALVYYQRRSDQLNEHRRRAFENHLPHYESIFASARSVQEALHNYLTIGQRQPVGHNTFLEMLVEILKDACYRYCVAVDWRHNSAMAYLNLKLEKRCLAARKLLLDWLSRPRLIDGTIVYILKGGTGTRIDPSRLHKVPLGAYDELRIETRTIVSPHPKDRRQAKRIDKALGKVIAELKEVMSY